MPNRAELTKMVEYIDARLEKRRNIIFFIPLIGVIYAVIVEIKLRRNFNLSASDLNSVNKFIAKQTQLENIKKYKRTKAIITLWTGICGLIAGAIGMLGIFGLIDNESILHIENPWPAIMLAIAGAIIVVFSYSLPLISHIWLPVVKKNINDILNDQKLSDK